MRAPSSRAHPLRRTRHPGFTRPPTGGLSFKACARPPSMLEPMYSTIKRLPLSGQVACCDAARVEALRFRSARAVICLAHSSNTQYSTQYGKIEDSRMSVPHALLALLSEGPKYGLRLQNEFES